MGWIGPVFASIWGHYSDTPTEEDPLVAIRAPAAPKWRPKSKAKAKCDPGRQEDEEYQKRQRLTRARASKLTQCRLFLAMVVISYYVKLPLVHFMAWLQAATQEHLAHEEAARSAGSTYLGPTPLSYLVREKKIVFGSKLFFYGARRMTMRASFEYGPWCQRACGRPPGS